MQDLAEKSVSTIHAFGGSKVPASAPTANTVAMAAVRPVSRTAKAEPFG